MEVSPCIVSFHWCWDLLPARLVVLTALTALIALTTLTGSITAAAAEGDAAGFSFFVHFRDKHAAATNLLIQ